MKKLDLRHGCLPLLDHSAAAFLPVLYPQEP
jgi:hypothetical protein